MIKDAPKPTDKQVLTRLVTAGIPARYRRHDLALATSAGKPGETLSGWMRANRAFFKAGTTGKCALEITGTSQEVTDAFFLLARGRVLLGATAAVLHVEELLLDGDVWERLQSLTELFVHGCVTEGRDPFSPRDMQRLEWVLGTWMNSLRPLVLLNDEPFCTRVQWGKRFVSSVQSFGETLPLNA